MPMDWTAGIDRPLAQLALTGPDRALVEAWFAEDAAQYTAVPVGADGFPESDSPIGAEPVILRLDHESVAANTTKTQNKLESLSARAPVIAIVDAETVELLPDFFDVEPVDFVLLSCGKGAFMNAIRQVASPSLRERAESRPISPDVLRDEIERIARALSALVDQTPTAEQPVRTVRDRRESARLLRAIIRRRRARAQFFPADLFADPAWDILLDLAAARHEATRVSISSLCIAAAVPTTTALRWIKGMTAAGVLEREDDPEDGRRSFIRLSDRTAAAMDNYLSAVEEGVV